MDSFKILIDRSTIRRNPNAGRNTYHIPGPVHCSNGPTGITMTREFQTMHTMCPEPSFFFSYIPTEVECDTCHQKFLHTELQADVEYDGEGGEFYSDRICPRCREFDCCFLDCERIDYDEMDQIARKNGG